MPANDREDKHWQPPSNEGWENAGRRMGWINDVVTCGEQYNSSLMATKDIGASIDMISGRDRENKPNQSRSNLNVNRGKRVLREVNANIADIRAVDAYTTENPAYQSYISMQNKVWKAVYFESKFPSALKRAVQWMTVGGYSYISPVYRNLRMSSKSDRAIDFDAFSSNDVLPFQMPENNKVQGAYAYTIVRFLPEFEAHAKFPNFAARLRPIARRRYSGDASKDRISLAERFRVGDNNINSAWQAMYDEIRWTYVNDLSINKTKKPIPMGAPGSLESYVVPFVGMDIPTGEMLNGFRVTRKATEEDCYLYPNLRLFISQRGMDVPLYDGPAFDWHGMFPLARFSADEWPWEPGYSLAHEIFSLEESRTSQMRGMDQTARQRFDPALMYNKSAGINRKTMESFDPYEERARLGVDGEVDDKMVRTMLPTDLLNIPSWAFDWTKLLNDDEDYVLGVSAMQNLAKAKMSAASGNVVEKAMEEAGPIVKDISHGMEMPMQDIMQMVLYLVMQYYSTGRIMQYVGPDGVSKETFDLNPENLYPSHGFDEDPANGKSVYSRMERVKMFCSQIHANITPGSLHGIVQTPQKLMYMQLQRSGFMIDSETVAKAMDIPNWGTLKGNTIREKWESEQRQKLEFAAKMEELKNSILPQGSDGAPPGGGQKAKPGRPPSGKKPPQMKTKGSAEGPRATITES